MRRHARAISYFFSIVALAAIFFSVEFIIEKFLCQNDEVVDIIAATAGALSFAQLRRFFDRVTDRIFFRGPRDARAEFITNVSHELQTPIAILRGNMELLQRRTITDAERASAERVIVTTLDGMSRLIGNVLESAKLRFSQMTFLREEVDVRSLLHEAQEDCLLLAQDKEIQLSIDADGEDEIYMCGDRAKLKEVLLNLISNSLKHTPGGGVITLRAELATGKARITVEDTGFGITPADLPHIFERFYRIAEDRASGPGRTVPGNGIGLNICREIVEAHGGTICAESEPEKGSRFTISLPLSPPTKPRTTSPAASAIINS